jgi:hypothetical protein
MADTFAVTVNSDGSATVSVQWDTTGTGLGAWCAANSTTYDLPSPAAKTDSNGDAVAATPWTSDTAIAAVRAQSDAGKANWVAAQLAAGE